MSRAPDCQHCYCSEGYLSVHTRWGCTITNPVFCCKCRAEKQPGVKAQQHAEPAPLHT